MTYSGFGVYQSGQQTRCGSTRTIGTTTPPRCRVCQLGFSLAEGWAQSENWALSRVPFCKRYLRLKCRPWRAIRESHKRAPMIGGQTLH